jgi:hypothetical protein
MKVATEHYNTSLLFKYGLCPWKDLVSAYRKSASRDSDRENHSTIKMKIAASYY